jgi:hypothetical protein
MVQVRAIHYNINRSMKIQDYRLSLRRLTYRIRHEYMTLNNVVIVVALVIAASWAWGSMSVMQRNFTLQRSLEDKKRQQTLATLEVETLKYQSAYYKSTEYQELTAREHDWLALPGEKLLILPPNSAAAQAPNPQPTQTTPTSDDKPTNFQAWMDFFSGANAKRLQ